MKIIKSNNYKISVKSLAMLVFSVNLGNVINIFGIKLSYIAALLFLFFFIIDRKELFFAKKSLNNWFWFFIIWLIYSTTQMIFVKNRELSLSWYLVLFINVFICCFMLLLIKTKQDFLFILNIFSLSFMLNIAVGYWELFTGKHIAVATRLLAGYQGKVAGFIGNFNDFGSVFLFMAIVIFLIQIYLSNNLIRKVIYLLGIISSIHLIFVNGSRGGVYSVYLLVLVIPFYFYEKFLKSKKIKIILQIALLLVLSIFGFYIINKLSYKEFIALLGSSGDYGSDLYRVKLILGGLRALVSSCFLGIGPGQSLLLNAMNIHNFYIEILTEYGLFIGIGVIWISFVIPFKSVKHNSNFINALLKATAIAMIIATLSSSSSFKMRALWVFIILLLIIRKTDVLDEICDKNQD